MDTWKIVCTVILFAVLIISDIICIVHFANEKEAYKTSLLVDWNANKKAQVHLIYHYLEKPEIFQENIEALTFEDLQGFMENEVILKKVDDSTANTLLDVFILILVVLFIGLCVFIGIISDF